MSSESSSNKDLKSPDDYALWEEVDRACDSITTIARSERNKHYLNQAEMKAVDNSVRKTRTAIDALFNRLEETKHSNRYLHRRAETRKVALNEKRGENTELKEKVRELEKDQTPTRTRASSEPPTKLLLCEANLAREPDKLKILAAAHKATNQELGQLKTQLDAQSDKLKANDGAISKWKQDLHYAQRLAQQRLNGTNELEVAMQGKEAELKAKKDIIGLKVAEIQSQKSNVDLKDHSLAQLRKKMQTHEGHTRQIQAALESERKETRTLNDNMAWRTKEIKQLKASIKQKDADYNVLNGLRAQEETELAELRKARETRGVKTMDYNSALLATDENGIEIRVKLVCMETEIKEFEKSIEQKDAELELIKTNADLKNQKLADLKNAHQGQAAGTAETKAALEARNKAIQALEDKVTSKTKELEEVQQAMESQAAETEMLWNRVAQLQMESKKRLRSD